jgi:multidrug efflux pump subunit AcrB
MTSITFTAAVVPLVLATGAGAEVRHALGMAGVRRHDRRDRCSGCS